MFALPFAVLAAFWTVPTFDPDAVDWPGFFGHLALIVVCMFFARTWAMVVNRLADHRFDAENPRTARRAIPSGRLTVGRGWGVALVAAAMFCLVTSLFWIVFANPWPVILSVPVLAWIALYSFTKRFTLLCHFFLGSALAVSPIAAIIAIEPGAIFTMDPSPLRTAALLLALFVMLWVAGFDVAYALQDLDFDRRTGLRSIPARLGVRGALWTARILHACALAALCGVCVVAGLRPLFPIAVGLVAILLIVEHTVLARRGVAGLPVAFFTLNGVISITLAFAGILDVLGEATGAGG